MALSAHERYVKGMTKVLRNLNKQLRHIPKLTLAALIKVGLRIQRNSMMMVPVDYGNLRASAYTTWSGKTKSDNPEFKGKDASFFAMDHQRVVSQATASLGGLLMARLNPTVEVGYSAFYSVFVHENLEAKHTVGQAQFLSQAVNEETVRMVSDMQMNIRRGIR